MYRSLLFMLLSTATLFADAHSPLVHKPTAEQVHAACERVKARNPGLYNELFAEVIRLQHSSAKTLEALVDDVLTEHHVPKTNRNKARLTMIFLCGISLFQRNQHYNVVAVAQRIHDAWYRVTCKMFIEYEQHQVLLRGVSWTKRFLLTTAAVLACWGVYRLYQWGQEKVDSFAAQVDGLQAQINLMAQQQTVADRVFADVYAQPGQTRAAGGTRLAHQPCEAGGQQRRMGVACPQGQGFDHNAGDYVARSEVMGNCGV